MSDSIYLEVNHPGWAFERIADQIVRRLGDRFPLEKGFRLEKRPKPRRGVSFWWKDDPFEESKKSAVCLYDQASWTNSDAADLARRYGAILCANRSIAEQVRSIPAVSGSGCRILEVQDGVDTTMFRSVSSASKAGPLRVGWAGRFYSGAFGDGMDPKGIGLLKELWHKTEQLYDWRVIDANCNPLDYDRMPEWFRSLDVYLCTSAAEGTPNTILESLACGVRVLTAPIGVVPELLDDGAFSGVLVERTLRSFLSALSHEDRDKDRTRQEISNDSLERLRARWDWSHRMEAWEEALNYIDELDSRPAAIRSIGDPPPCGLDDMPDSGVLDFGFTAGETDLRDSVTVYVATVGAADFPWCMDALRKQDSSFNLKIVRNVAPMSAAFQEMLDDCRTPYYVQVDEDMILRPDAVRKLYEAIVAQPPSTAIWFFGLHDVLTGLCLTGVKIYRCEIVAQYPYRTEDFSCEVGQAERMKADGFEVRGRYPGLRGNPKAESCVGELNSHWTPWGAFEKYSRDMQKFRRQADHQGWMKILPGLFLEKVLADPSEIHLAALAGCIVGLSMPAGKSGEKDFRRPAYRKAWERIEPLLKAGRRR